MTYRLCMALIKAGRTAGLADKIDVFFAAGRLTEAEYEKLISLLPAAGDS